MPRDKSRTFGDIVRDRRRHLDLTQAEVARRIKTSAPYVGHLEADKRHPSNEIVTRLAEALGLDSGELFLLANPHAKELIRVRHGKAESTWDEFQRDDRLIQVHKITPQEMDMLSQVALMGDVRSVRDFIYVLNTVRQALSRPT